jgi:hypothetical protein
MTARCRKALHNPAPDRERISRINGYNIRLWRTGLFFDASGDDPGDGAFPVLVDCHQEPCPRPDFRV